MPQIETCINTLKTPADQLLKEGGMNVVTNAAAPAPVKPEKKAA